MEQLPENKKRTADPTLRGSIAIRLPDLGELGPIMRSLPSDRMRAFVIAMHDLAMSGGHVSQARAAGAAGYDGNANTLGVTGHRLAHDERIQAAMLEEGHRRLGALVPLATATLAQLLQDPSEKVRAKAIAMVLNRVGMPETTQHNVKVERSLSREEKINHAMDLAKTLGIDPRSLLGDMMPAAISAPQAETRTQVSDVIEGDFTVVEPEVRIEQLADAAQMLADLL